MEAIVFVASWKYPAFIIQKSLQKLFLAVYKGFSTHKGTVCMWVAKFLLDQGSKVTLVSRPEASDVSLGLVNSQTNKQTSLSVVCFSFE